jgi:hypothetical protein
MQPHQSTPPTLSAEQFFEMVETLLTPPMAALGYHRIHGSVNDQPGSRSILGARGSSPGGTQREDAPFLWFEFGYEAGSDDVARLVGPTDPQSQDEWWVNYEPATGRLELGDWAPVAADHVDWDIRRDHGPCSVSEVHRRLAAVAQAVSVFVQRHGGYP